jgi:hypothetical protein
VVRVVGWGQAQLPVRICVLLSWVVRVVGWGQAQLPVRMSAFLSRSGDRAGDCGKGQLSARLFALLLLVISG